MGDNDTDQNLRIYLNDHHAGSTAGLELAKRARGNCTDAVREEMWESICVEVDADRIVLLKMIARLGFTENRFKLIFSWLLEKAGRLKPNGHIGGPSDLGQYLELEMMMLGVTGKLSLWLVLAQADDPRLRDFDFPELIDRAESQRDRIDEHRLSLGAVIFGDGT